MERCGIEGGPRIGAGARLHQIKRGGGATVPGCQVQGRRAKRIGGLGVGAGEEKRSQCGHVPSPGGLVHGAPAGPVGCVNGRPATDEETNHPRVIVGGRGVKGCHAQTRPPTRIGAGIEQSPGGVKAAGIGSTVEGGPSLPIPDLGCGARFEKLVDGSIGLDGRPVQGRSPATIGSGGVCSGSQKHLGHCGMGDGPMKRRGAAVIRRRRGSPVVEKELEDFFPAIASREVKRCGSAIGLCGVGRLNASIGISAALE